MTLAALLVFCRLSAAAASVVGIRSHRISQQQPLFGSVSVYLYAQKSTYSDQFNLNWIKLQILFKFNFYDTSFIPGVHLVQDYSCPDWIEQVWKY